MKGAGLAVQCSKGGKICIVLISRFLLRNSEKEQQVVFGVINKTRRLERSQICLYLCSDGFI